MSRSLSVWRQVETVHHLVSLVRGDRGSFSKKGTPRKYAPDENLSQKHLKILLEIFPEEKAFKGEVTLTLETSSKATKRIQLDAEDMQINRVSIVGGKKLAFRYDGRKLAFDLPEPIKPGNSVDVIIKYQVRDPQAGLYFIHPDKDYPDHPLQVWSQGQDEDSRAWFPCLDAPLHKCTSEIRATVPEGFVAVSNGKLKAHRTLKNKREVWHFALDIPHSTYLIALAVGRFETLEDKAGDVEIRYVGEKGSADKLKRAFGNTPEMITTFSDWLGVPYPYASYTQVAVADFIFGGMENTTVTFQTDRVLPDVRAALDFDADYLVSHELAHQWFGDLVTCRHWDQAWLNEGFATFMEIIWMRHHKGEDEALHSVMLKRDSYIHEDRSRYQRPIVTRRYKNPIDLFDRHLYEKGSLVLWMLMDLLGEKDFRRVLKCYLNKFRFGVVETSDLISAIKEVTGKNLESFFDTWVFAPGHPEISLSATQSADGKTLHVRLRQTQSGDAVKLNLPLWIERGRRSHIEKLSMTAKSQSFTLKLQGKGQVTGMAANPNLTLLATVNLDVPLPWVVGALRRGPSVAARVHAARRLGNRRHIWVFEALHDALNKDKFWGVSAAAARALGRIGTPSAKDTLIEAQGHKHPKVRRAVARALGEFRDDAVGLLLSKWLDKGDPSYFVEAEVATSLGKTRYEPGFKTLKKAVTRASWNEVVRAGVLKGMACYDTPEAVKAILTYLRRGVAEPARLAAMKALSTTSASRARLWPELEALIKEPGYRLHLALVDAAAELGEGRGEAILGVLRDAQIDPRISRKATEALERMQKKQTESQKLSRIRNDLDALQRTNEELWAELRANK